jgi:hypothetical protein
MLSEHGGSYLLEWHSSTSPPPDEGYRARSWCLADDERGSRASVSGAEVRCAHGSSLLSSEKVQKVISTMMTDARRLLSRRRKADRRCHADVDSFSGDRWRTPSSSPPP